MKALITGIEGFVGPHLHSFLTRQGIETFGTYRKSENPKKNFYRMDITDKEEVSQVIAKIRPDYIFHLAGFSSVGKSFGDPEGCRRINVEGTKNILDAVVENRLKARILIVSSAEVYGEPSFLPIKEDHRLSAKSPYGESRIEQEALCREYVQKHGLLIVISRSFNHTGPGQKDMFVLPTFAKQIVLIEKGRQESIKVGNLDVVRDFSDVRDVVKAYYLALTKGEKGEVYNICSGKGHSLKELLQFLINASCKEIKIEQDPARMRPADIPILIGDNTKFRKTMGWEPEIKISKTLSDVLSYWREMLNQ